MTLRTIAARAITYLNRRLNPPVPRVAAVTNRHIVICTGIHPTPLGIAWTVDRQTGYDLTLDGDPLGTLLVHEHTAERIAELLAGHGLADIPNTIAELEATR